MRRLGTVYLLDEDSTLRALVPENDRSAARDALTATAYEAPRGPWHPGRLRGVGEPPFALLVLDGLLIRDVTVAHTSCGELVGPGELLRPWDNFSERAPMPLEVGWEVLEPLRIAVLGHGLAGVLAPWPALVNALAARAVERASSLALHVAIHCIKRVDVSLLVLFSHLADRFGKVTRDGIAVPVRLRHEDLGKLVGATRQSISVALGELADRGAVVRRADRTWLLGHETGAEIEEMLAHRSRRPDDA